MANHTDDCNFCGRDRRIEGDQCCDANIAANAKKTAKLASMKESRRLAFRRYGLPTGKHVEATVGEKGDLRMLCGCGTTLKSVGLAWVKVKPLTDAARAMLEGIE